MTTQEIKKKNYAFKKLLKEHNITLTEVAKRLNISKQAVSYYICTSYNPTFECIARYAKAIGASFESVADVFYTKEQQDFIHKYQEEIKEFKARGH